jgi:hypothetical protein
MLLTAVPVTKLASASDAVHAAGRRYSCRCGNFDWLMRCITRQRIGRPQLR